MTDAVHYITGGTTQAPRIISYSPERWERSIASKAAYFERIGLGTGMRLAVCHPFAPWAIGQVFTEGALRCGAEVFPVGLALADGALRDVLGRFKPTHLCASPRNLVRIGQLLEGSISEPVMTISSGERLIQGTREKIASMWAGEVLDVYGMAEFDMLGGQMPGREGLALVEALEFGLRNAEGGADPLEIGARGLLLVRDDPTATFHSTGDQVAVVDVGDFWGSRRQSFAVSVFGREDGAIFLMDGSMLNPLHVAACFGTLAEVDDLQVVVRRQRGGDHIDIRFVSDGGSEPTPEAVVKALLASALDLADAYRLGAVQSVTATSVGPNQLHRTTRDKAPAIWVIGDA